MWKLPAKAVQPLRNCADRIEAGQYSVLRWGGLCLEPLGK